MIYGVAGRPRLENLILVNHRKTEFELSSTLRIGNERYV
jgi:hypothetical protein